MVAWLSRLYSVLIICTNPSQARVLDKRDATIAAMKEGIPIIVQAVLWNEDDRMYGMVDLP